MVSKAFYIRVSTANVSSFGWLFTPRQCRDIKKYRWTPAGASGLARGVRSVMPLPSDLPLPTWLARSLKVPEETAFTTVVRLTGLGSDPEAMAEAETQQLVLLMQSCSHDAPYGEYFRIQVGHSFAAVRLGRCLYSSYGPVSSVEFGGDLDLLEGGEGHGAQAMGLRAVGEASALGTHGATQHHRGSDHRGLPEGARGPGAVHPPGGRGGELSAKRIVSANQTGLTGTVCRP